MDTHNVLFIGAGRMAQAMIRGISTDSGDMAWRISVANRQDADKRALLAKTFGTLGVERWQDAIEDTDVVILAMPPEAHPEILRHLATRLHHGQLVVSVAAGIGLRGLEAALGPDVAVAWCMPNIAASVGQSMTLAATGQSMTADHERLLFDILEGLGKFEVCSEEDIHHWTAITGSAPAFVFQLAHTLEDFAIEGGMAADTARRLVGQMILGSGHLLLAGQNPLQLSDEVTTPGGSTAAGHAVLETWRWHEALRAAILAVTNHASGTSTGESPASPPGNR